MQQATVNLFADMGAQPARCRRGLARRPRRPTRDRSDLGDHVAGSGGDGPDRRAGHDHRHGDRRAAAAWSAASRSRPTTAPRGTRRSGRANWTYTWTPARDRHVTIKARAVDDSGNLETPGAGVTVNVDAVGPAPARSGTSSVTAPAANHDPGGGRGRRQVPLRRRPATSPASASTRARATPARTSATCGQPPARSSPTATFTGETGVRLAAGQPRQPRSRSRANTTYVASYSRARPATTRFTGGYFATGGVDNAPLHALASGVGRAERRLPLRRRAAFPTRHLPARPTTGSTSSSTTPSAGHDARRRSPRVSPGQRRHQRLDRRRRSRRTSASAMDADDDQRRPRSRCAIRSNAIVPATVTYDAAPGRRRSPDTAPLQRSTTYTATVNGGAERRHRLAAGERARRRQDLVVHDRAPPPPPPDEGPGGPILVISIPVEPVRPLLRRDPARRGPQRVHRRPTSPVTPATADRARRRHPRQTAR